MANNHIAVEALNIVKSVLARQQVLELGLQSLLLVAVRPDTALSAAFAKELREQVAELLQGRADKQPDAPADSEAALCLAALLECVGHGPERQHR